MSKKKWAIAFGLCTMFCLSILLIIKNKTQLSTISMWVKDPPYSIDPINYNAYIHHVAFRSVLSSVLTQYHLGRYDGVLAESWHPSSDYKEWKLKIRKGLHFENGDEIEPSHILKSWMRIAYFQKQKDSKSGFLENLVGFDKIKSIHSMIEGLKIRQDEIVLTFKKPMKKLLETISFGLYSVVHPNDYNQKTGKWINPRNAVSSGRYKIISWTKDELKLQLRDDFLPSFGHPYAAKTVSIIWNAKQRSVADLSFGGSNDSPFSEKEIFQGPMQSNMSYLYCTSWSDPKSVFYKKEDRIFLRTEFYKILNELGTKTTLSFFPLTIKNIKESSLDNHLLIQSNTIKNKNLTYTVSTSKNPLYINLNNAMKKLENRFSLKTKAIKIPFQSILIELDSKFKKRSFDMTAMSSGILIDDPLADIRFMFLSKEGIRLPDTDGRIVKELKKENFEPQKINELLWDQAVIWPLGHFSIGLWAKENIDFSMINTTLPPTDFQWIGLKK